MTRVLGHLTGTLFPCLWPFAPTSSPLCNCQSNPGNNMFALDKYGLSKYMSFDQAGNPIHERHSIEI
jgi:hypothetical protein